MKEVTLQVHGINGPPDAEKLMAALHDVWGIREADVSAELNKVTISYNEKAGSLVDFMQAIQESGFEPVQE